MGVKRNNFSTFNESRTFRRAGRAFAPPPLDFNSNLFLHWAKDGGTKKLAGAERVS